MTHGGGDSSEDLDPRIQVELEKLNTATDAINRLEIELDDVRAALKKTFNDNIVQLSALSSKHRGAIEKSQPYFEVLDKSKQLQAETHKWASRYEKACTCHRLAKEMVRHAEAGTLHFDTLWQEMLNKATMKVNEAERERRTSQVQHQASSQAYAKLQQELTWLRKELRKPIGKAKKYYELKEKFNDQIQAQRQKIWRLEEQMLRTKLNYTEALHSLELISEEIHQKRQQPIAITEPLQPHSNNLPDVVEGTQLRTRL